MSSDSDSNSDNNCDGIVSEQTRQAAKNVSLDLLPKISKQLYTAAYNAIKKWRSEKGSNSFCEDVVLVYFSELSKKYAPLSLWSIYSMLKTTINSYDQIDISNYKRLTSFLKKQSSGYFPKKSAVFKKDNISKFLNEAPDDAYLSTKVNKTTVLLQVLNNINYSL